MSNVQITKRHKNVTTDKLNVNPLLIGKEVRLIFRWLEVVCSLSPPDDFEPSENQAMKKWKQVFTPPPRETQADEWGDCPLFFPAMPRVGVDPNDWCETLIWHPAAWVVYAVLCCAVLCCDVCAVLCCMLCMLCCTVLCVFCCAVCAVLCVLCCAVLWSTCWLKC